MLRIGIQVKFFPDPQPIFQLRAQEQIFGEKHLYSFDNWLKLFSVRYLLKNKYFPILWNMLLWQQEKVRQQKKFFPLLFFVVVGSGIRAGKISGSKIKI